MGNYALPTNTDYISSDYWDHRNRRPPSQEAGTDYGVGYGSPMYSPYDGVVVDVKHSNSGAMGRYAKINLDDGKGTRGLHGAEIWVVVGQRVGRGQQIGLTGGSANGSDWGVGTHIHQTLWNSWDYAFGDGATINFADYVGSGVIAGYQRTVGGNGASVRSDPSTANAKLDTFAPGVVCDFNGWIHGENVEGNDVWFRGALTGVWLWSGGFTDGGTHDLADLNPVAPPIQPDERKAGPGGANGRGGEPSTGVPVVYTIGAGQLGKFIGWRRGETVEGNNVWFKGTDADPGVWYWSGGFEDKDTHNLPDLNAPAPPVDQNRVVGAEVANVRLVPWLTSPTLTRENPQAAIKITGYAKGEAVEGNDIWFQRWDQRWMWSGGFTSQSTEGLKLMATPPKPTAPVDELNNPLGLPEYTPVWAEAVIGLEAPLGFQEDGTRADRNVKGEKKVKTTGIISNLALHWTGVLPDQLSYFSQKNDRDSCPSFYFRTSGKIFELIRPGVKPAATGSEWNWRSIAVEMQMGPTSPTISRVQQEAAARLAVRMQEATLLEGGVWDGAKIDFIIERSRILGHNEMLPGTTQCPGPDMDADWITARALELWDEKHPDDPTPPPTDQILVDREFLEQLQANQIADADEIAKVLKG